jgi:hypothetical protein
MRLHLKIEPEEQDKITHVFFKASIFHTAQFKMMSEIFPQFTLTFNTRHPAPSIRSNLQVGKTIDQSLFWKLGIWWRSLLKGSYLFYFEPEFDDIKAHFNPCFMNMSIEEFYLRWHCIFCKSYFQHKDIYSKVILYEDLSENPRRVMEDLFALIKLDQGMLDLALEALNHDSQNVVDS